MTLPRRAALVFGLFLIFVIILADRGQVRAVFGFLYNFPNGDKVGHFAMFGMLSFLLSLNFPPTRIRLIGLRPLKSSLILAAIVTLEEISQSFFPSRRADILDLTASLAGIFLLAELGVYLRGRKWFQQRNPHA